jgi:hypothetical protein
MDRDHRAGPEGDLLVRDPGMALYLYLLVVICAFLLTPRWGAVRDVLTSGGTTKLAATK